MKRIACILALLFALSGTAAEPLRIDFTRVRPLVEKGKLGSFSGELTEGWKPDYPDWNGSIASGRATTTPNTSCSWRLPDWEAWGRSSAGRFRA